MVRLRLSAMSAGEAKSSRLPVELAELVEGVLGTQHEIKSCRDG